jgi:putative membrane protein
MNHLEDYMANEKFIESRFAQQHLANERTFLAWIRTGITIIGLGFLAAGVVFQSTPSTHWVHTFAAIVAIVSVLLGTTLMGLSTRNYLLKRDRINTDTFRSSYLSIWFLFAFLSFINIALIFLVVILVVN